MQWPKYLSASVLALLEREDEVTKKSLEAHLHTLCEADGATPIERAAMHGAIKALNGNPPSSL